MFLGDARDLLCENFFCDVYLVTLVDQIILGPVGCPAKYSLYCCFCTAKWRVYSLLYNYLLSLEIEE